MDKWRYSYLIELKTLLEKEEIARYEQFLLFPQCFQKLSVVDASKRVSMELRVKKSLLPGIVKHRVIRKRVK